MKQKVVLTYRDFEGNLSEETIWAVKTDGNSYKVDNIPFYAPNLALGDIISVENDQGVLYFDNLIETSGHSTIQIIFFDSKQSEKVINRLEAFGCQWESMKGQPYFAVDVPADIDYSKIKKFLDVQLENQVLDYKEACLSKNHN